MFIRAFQVTGFVFWLIALGSAAAVCGEAQQKVPIENLKDTAGTARAARLDDVSRVEAETIEIGPGGAIPAAIQRPAGKFILLLANRTHEAGAAFIVDPAAVGEGVIGPEPLLRLTDAPTRSKHRMAGLIELPAGEFHLKSAKTGKVLCRITIE